MPDKAVRMRIVHHILLFSLFTSFLLLCSFFCVVLVVSTSQLFIVAFDALFCYVLAPSLLENVKVIFLGSVGAHTRSSSSTLGHKNACLCKVLLPTETSECGGCRITYSCFRFHLISGATLQNVNVPFTSLPSGFVGLSYVCSPREYSFYVLIIQRL